ncbi:MAG TPA: gamma-glutamyltransferase [Candidatus Dormibacteraeota bacterium]|nr:gamma-glutamyltransferase [Candidatus Dormibacteraeota bacterium]
MRGIIVCPQPAAAEAGLEVFRRGANAVDAGVTTAFCQGVIEPQMCGVGGSGMMTAHRAGTGVTEVIEFHARAGGAIRPDQWERSFQAEAVRAEGRV